MRLDINDTPTRYIKIRLVFHSKIITYFQRYFSYTRPLAVIIKNNEYIGYSYLWGGSDKILVHNGMTGVKKDFRGHGIATILKVLGIHYAQENKYKILWFLFYLILFPYLL